MQSTIKSFFGKAGNSSKTSITAANKSPTKPVQSVQLVSYNNTNSPIVAPSRPLKRKTPEPDPNKRIASKSLYDKKKTCSTIPTSLERLISLVAVRCRFQ